MAVCVHDGDGGVRSFVVLRGKDKDNVCVTCWCGKVSLMLARDLALTPESTCLS